MRLFIFIVFLALSLAAIPAQKAVAAVSPACPTPTASGCTLVGKACDTLGQTKMDNDQKNIIVCVCSNNANCNSTDMKWQTITGNAN